MHVEFPQCWNGLDVDSGDHRSHMAYPKSGQCPSSHPVPIPAITFNIPYRVPQEGTDGWRLVSDSYDASKAGGYSAHGDWFGAWDPEIAETWTHDCINAGVDCHSHLLGDGREMYFSTGEPINVHDVDRLNVHDVEQTRGCGMAPWFRKFRHPGPNVRPHSGAGRWTRRCFHSGCF
jgi:hypothetical protein